MKKLLLAVALCLFAVSATAQSYVSMPDERTSDLRMRGGVSVNYKFHPRWTISLEEQARMKDCLRAFDRSYTTLGLDYKLNPYFKIGAAYRFMLIDHDGKKSTDYQKYWDLRHRAWLSFTGQYKLGQWKFSLREKPVMTFRTDDFVSGEKVNPAFLLRSKAEVSYKFFSKPLTPYLSFELSNTLNVPEVVKGNYIDELRYCAGVKWKLSPHYTLDFFYRLDDERGIDINIKQDGQKIELTNERDICHIFGIFLDISLKK